MTIPFILDSKYEQDIDSICYDTFKLTLPILPIPKNKLIVKSMNPSESFYEASQLVTMLSPQRAIDSTTWLSIGTILHRISNGSINGLDAWIGLSTSSIVTVPTQDICSRYWYTMTMKSSHESSIHTLVQYIREDANDTYQKYKYATSQKKTSQLIKDKLTRLKPCHFGEVLYLLCKYEYLYDDENGWYQWKEDTWNSCTKECRSLRNSISLIKEMMITEYKNMYQNDISPLQDMIRDIQDKEEISGEDEKGMEEHYKKITELEEKRVYLLTLCEKLDELVYKNKIIKECTDLFYDTDGIIARYVKSQEIVNITPIKQDNTIQKNQSDNTNSPLLLFVIHLVTTDKCKQNIISLTNDELISKCNTFCKKHNVHIKTNHTITRQLNALYITGITIGVRDRQPNIHKTEFDKKVIKEYLCL